MKDGAVNDDQLALISKSVFDVGPRTRALMLLFVPGLIGIFAMSVGIEFPRKHAGRSFDADATMGRLGLERGDADDFRSLAPFHRKVIRGNPFRRSVRRFSCLRYR